VLLVYIQTVVQPLKCFGGTLRVWRCVLISWLLSVVVAIPQSTVFVQTAVHNLTPDMTRYVTTYKCESTGYTTDWQRKVYFTSVATFLLIIPACIIIYCYANIIRVVWLRAGPEAARNIDQPRVHFVSTHRRETASDPAVCLAEIRSSNNRPSSDKPRFQSLPQNSPEAIRVLRGVTLTSKRSVIRMAMSVTIGFILCWLPFYIVTGVRIYSDYQYKWAAAKSVSLIMALCHSAVNPLVYIMFSRRAVHAAFHRLCQRAKPRCC